MSRTPTWVVSVAVLAMALGFAGPAAAADDGGDEAPDEAAQNSALIEIPYGDPGELRVAEGVRIDCDALRPVDGVEVACEPDGLVLEVAGYDPEWGERVLPVTLEAGSARTVVNYRVALAPPAAPEVTRTRIDHPYIAGSQALVPLSVLGIVCTLCDAASVHVDEVTPDSAFAGVGATHLAVRSTAPGDVVVALRIEDDAGQQVDAEVTVSFVAGEDAVPHALHVSIAPAAEVDLTALAWGDDLTFSCSAADAAVARPPTCTGDGRASFTGTPVPGEQFVFRVVDSDGRQALGSVTFVESAEGAPGTVPVAPVWDDTAELGVRVAAPPDDEDDDTDAPLSRLSRILQEVPAP